LMREDGRCEVNAEQGGNIERRTLNTEHRRGFDLILVGRK
jgi:hypothetical protein